MKNKEKYAIVGFAADADNAFCFPDAVLKAFSEPICEAFFAFFRKKLPVFSRIAKKKSEISLFFKKNTISISGEPLR